MNACNLENVWTTLEEYGYAVINNVLPHEDIEQIRSIGWNDIKQWSKGLIDVENQETWENIYKFYPKHSMMIQEYGVGHMKWLWKIRQHPNIINVFSKLWNTDDLLVSFDAFSIHFPPEITNRGWYRGSDWYHTDISPKRTEVCIQGLVNLYDVNEGDATLSVYEGSHKYHKEFFETFNKDIKDDWYKLATEEEISFFQKKNCQKRFITAKAGSIVLWDSRTFHQGTEARRTRETPNFRMVSYVCMTPRQWSTEKDMERKRNAFVEGRTTSHWPHRIKKFAMTPRTYGGPAPPPTNDIPVPLLTDMGKKLAGF